MAFNIYYFSHTKRINSTLRPDISDLDNVPHDSVVLKEGTSYLNPVFQIYKGSAFDPQTGGFYWNYLYVPRWTRFYFIDDIVYNEGFLELHCKEDVLASWRGAIGSSTLYILRASEAYDGNIADTLYPTKTNATYSYNEGTSPFIHRSGTDNINISDGTFILGIVSKRGTYGSVRYVALSQSALRTLCMALMDDSLLTSGSSPIDLNDASLVLQKSLMNPLQYIVSCLWVPTLYASVAGTEEATLDVWDWSVTVTNKNLGGELPYIMTASAINLNKHPQASSRGAYLNTAPYTNIWLSFPPFGMIELDTTLYRDATQVRCYILTDNITGQGILRVNNGTVDTNRIEAQIGVPIQLSQVVKDYLTGAQSAVNTIGSVIGSAVVGDIGGAITGAANGIAEGIRAMIPKLSTTGTGGGFASLRGQPTVYHEFFPIVDEYNAELGRPYCRTATPASLEGYLKCLGDVPIYGTTAEHDEIQEYITNGFYYE
jgi:hypothetical protein